MTDSLRRTGVSSNNYFYRESKLTLSPDCRSKNEYTVGSTRGSGFIPGYQGFIPTNTVNPQVAAYERSCGGRPHTKSDIQYSREMPGYTGYRPLHVLNVPVLRPCI